MHTNYDVVILGGGLAGLTLALQLKQSKPDISILVLEKRAGAASKAAHKVGESTVELGTYYLREVLNLKDYLDREQLPKHGLRFFFSPKHKDELHRRVELGPRQFLPVPSHQIDRGVFENDLIQKLKDMDVSVELGARVKDVELRENELHQVIYAQQKEDKQVQSSWVVDSTGRNAFMKKKLDFAEEVTHDVNAVWFRLDTKIDIQEWSEDREWLGKLKSDLRYLSTVHLMDTGYWVWIIPLVTGCTSIGIVADPKYHDFEKISRFEKAMEWLQENEPQCYTELNKHREKLLDFKILKHYAHGSGQIYSANRWGVSGESGYFLDPLYSPGTDLIAMNNTWLHDLILRDLAGESIQLHTRVYEETHRAIFKNWLPIYSGQYSLMGHTQIMVVKIFWDWAIYWGITALIFTNKGFTNISLLKKIASKPDTVLRRFEALNANVQQLFQDWRPYDTADITDHYIDPFDIDYLKEFHKSIEKQYDPRTLLNQLEVNMEVLEKIAAELIRLVSNQVHGTALNMEIDPYHFKLGERNLLADGRNVAKDAAIAEDVGRMWFYEKASATA